MKNITLLTLTAMMLFAGNDDIDEIAAAQTVVGDAQQGIGIRGQENADDAGLFIDDQIDEARVLVGKAVVILTPDMGCQQVIQ